MFVIIVDFRNHMGVRIPEFILDEDGNPALFNTREEAEADMQDHIMAKLFPWAVLELDSWEIE